MNPLFTSKKILLFLFVAMLSLVSSKSVAQKEITITGKVLESKSKEPIPGVSVLLKGSTRGVMSDTEGNYKIVVPNSQSILIYSILGFASQEIKVENLTLIDVEMESTENSLDEFVVVGYGTQRKESNVGSQATIRREDLKVPAANLSTAIAGRLAGIVATQRGGAPGSNGAELFVRGVATFASSPQGPLLVVDGVPDRDINNIDPEDIENFTVLKDATATAVYGARGANGVIIINTRRGKTGKPTVTAEFNQGITAFTYLPEFVDAPSFMTLYNEGLTMRGKPSFYSQETIDKHASGVDPDLYPNVNWYKQLFRDNGKNNKFNVNISGGGDVAQYFLSVGYYGEVGLFNTADIETYNSTLRYDRFNFTSNLNLKLSQTTRVDFGINGFLANQNRPNYGVNGIFALATATAPHIIPPIYSNGQYPRLTGTAENPYQALTQSGVTNSYNNVVRSNLKISQDLTAITKGLSLSAMFAFDVNLTNNLARGRTLPTYYAKGRDAEGNLITELSYNGTENLDFFIFRYTGRRIYSEGSVNYARAFGKHDVGGLLLVNQTDFSDGGDRVSTYKAAIPYRQRNYVGRATYSYDSKYLFETNFSYSGSDNFDPSNRYGLFSSVGAGWVVSNEKFFEGLSKVVPHFKLRYSYGSAGNASLNDPNARFLFLTTFGTDDTYYFGQPGSLRGFTGYNETLIGGQVTWETSYRHNLGIEFNLFNNDLKFIAELFNEDRKGILLRDQTYPYISGFSSGNVPYRNIGATNNKGIDITLEYNKSFKDGFFSFRGTYNQNRNIVKRDGLPPWAYPYLDRTGKRISQRFGYIAEGLFQSDEEIANSARQAGDIRVGDIKYKDLNGDGVINSMDQTAIGYGAVPLMMYGLSFGGGYKKFDLSLFFQGAGKMDLNYSSGFGTTPFSQGATYGNVYKVMEDRWNPENPTAKTLYPRLSTNETTTSNYYTSTWWIKRADYIRLKQAEFGYNFEKVDFLKKIGARKIRLYVNGLNLFTVSNWKIWDPELGDGIGAIYPNTRVYNLGFRVNFQ